MTKATVPSPLERTAAPRQSPVISDYRPGGGEQGLAGGDDDHGDGEGDLHDRAAVQVAASDDRGQDGRPARGGQGQASDALSASQPAQHAHPGTPNGAGHLPGVFMVQGGGCGPGVMAGQPRRHGRGAVLILARVHRWSPGRRRDGPGLRVVQFHRGVPSSCYGFVSTAGLRAGAPHRLGDPSGLAARLRSAGWLLRRRSWHVAGPVISLACADDGNREEQLTVGASACGVVKPVHGAPRAWPPNGREEGWTGGGAELPDGQDAAQRAGQGSGPVRAAVAGFFELESGRAQVGVDTEAQRAD